LRSGSIINSSLPTAPFSFDRRTPITLFAQTPLRCFTIRQRNKAKTFNDWREKRKPKLPRDFRSIRDYPLKKEKKKQKGKKREMKLQINVPVSGLDLASLLQGEEGFFLCQNRGQNFITAAKAGHSIAFGPTPIGKGIVEQPSATLGSEPWVVTKISNSTEFTEFRTTGQVPR
jgi:hypothetical protein